MKIFVKERDFFMTNEKKQKIIDAVVFKKKRCLVAGVLAFVMILSGCGGISLDSSEYEQSSTESSTESSEAVDWSWLATDEGAKLAKKHVQDDKPMLALYAKVDHVDTVVISSCILDKSDSGDREYYWKLKGYFYGKDEYGHTDGVYDYDYTVCLEGRIDAFAYEGPVSKMKNLEVKKAK